MATCKTYKLSAEELAKMEERWSKPETQYGKDVQALKEKALKDLRGRHPEYSEKRIGIMYKLTYESHRRCAEIHST